MAVTILVEHDHGGRLFRDTILLTDAEHAALSPEQIEAMKAARVQGWLIATGVLPGPEE